MQQLVQTGSLCEALWYNWKMAPPSIASNFQLNDIRAVGGCCGNLYSLLPLARQTNKCECLLFKKIVFYTSHLHVIGRNAMMLTLRASSKPFYKLFQASPKRLLHYHLAKHWWDLNPGPWRPQSRSLLLHQLASHRRIVLVVL